MNFRLEIAYGLMFRGLPIFWVEPSGKNTKALAFRLNVTSRQKVINAFGKRRIDLRLRIAESLTAQPWNTIDSEVWPPSLPGQSGNWVRRTRLTLSP